MVALGLGLGWAVTVLIFYTRTVGRPVDAWCYYGMDPVQPYRPDECFLYSPPIAQAMLVIHGLIPFEAFYTGLRVFEMIALALMTGPALGAALLIPAVAIEINAANINLLLVGAVLLGFRFPVLWSFIILTKVTPGVGVLWFAARKEWRSLAVVLGATTIIAATSFVVAPTLWFDYLGALAGAPDETPFKIWWRLPLAAAIVIWGARTDHRWALVVAVFLAMPRWYFVSPVILVGLFPLVTLPRPLHWPNLAAIRSTLPTRSARGFTTSLRP